MHQYFTKFIVYGVLSKMICLTILTRYFMLTSVLPGQVQDVSQLAVDRYQAKN
jgi:hypothetical protein